MRITNKMMTNNMLHNINLNKNNMTALENKYASGLEIQKPSDDPIVAVRALKLRNNLSELNQYYKKNIPDAKSWMESTESALKNTSEVITKLHTYCVQGANDTLTESERKYIVDNLLGLKAQVYQEGNANYAGRYLFTGYKTDTPLVFENAETSINYEITEKFEPSDIEISSRIVDSLQMEDFDLDSVDDFDTSVRPTSNTIYRIRLSYNNLKTVDKGGGLTIRIPEVDENGEIVKDDDGIIQYAEEVTHDSMNVVTSDDPLAYKPEDGEINYIEDTGEIIMSASIYNEWRKSSFEITYQKDSFSKNELRPEHYFDCIATPIEDGELMTEDEIQYKAEDQEISYEINFNQRLAINVQGKDAFRHSLGRAIDDIVSAISDVEAVKDKIAKVDKMLEDTSIDQSQINKLKEIRRVLNTELDLKDSLMREAYSKGLTAMTAEENTVNTATSDIGTRYNRLELAEDRLSTQQVEFTELLSQNEDADMVETIVNYNAANTVYNASLQAAGKVVKNTLLDFL